jgi:LuxR family maltose regulon positive regulatory protein
MRGKSKQLKTYCFSDRLKRQLEQMPYYPLTVVEAPSGFGKTTAVRAYLKEKLAPGAQEHWYTCLGEPPFMAWQHICALFAKANADTAARLLKLGMPSADTLMYVTPILKDLRCSAETYLVIDNYQLAGCDVPREMMGVFSMHGSSRLHLIFITQPLGTKPRITFHNARIHAVKASAFLLDRENTARLFRMQGIRLTDDALDTVHASTEGWVSAVRLQMINFEETGAFHYTADIARLVETAIWDRLTPEEKDFLLSVSVMDSFTVRQTTAMIGKKTLPESVKALLDSNDFIRYLPDKNAYAIHSILRDYLRNQLYQYRPVDFQKRILRTAGRCYAADSMLLTAARYFLMAGDYDALLSLPFDCTCISSQREKALPGLVLSVVRECPKETMCRYPFVLLVFAYALLLDGETEARQTLFRLIGLAAEKNTAGLSPADLRRLKGEFSLLLSLRAHNDIRKMGEGIRAALDILGEPSSVLLKDTPWTMGSTSILCLFWREPGKLDNTLSDLEAFLPYHLRLTRGQGAGAASAMRAEVMLMRGQDDEAEMLCYRALYEARGRQQVSVCLCAELVLARIAILRGDVDGYFIAVENIRSYADGNPQLYVPRMVDLCLAFISIDMGTANNVAGWLGNMESLRKTVYAPALPHVQLVYAWLLLTDKRYNEFYGISPPLMETAKSMHYIYPQVCHLLLLAAAKRRNGRGSEALAHLREALALALPDRIFLPFACIWDELGIPPESLKAGRESPVPGAEDRLDALMSLCERHKRGAGVIAKAIRTQSLLTPREKEVALLARDRLSAKEIAGRLYISEKTVKTILHNVYSKLGVHSRLELSCKNF